MKLVNLLTLLIFFIFGTFAVSGTSSINHTEGLSQANSNQIVFTVFEEEPESEVVPVTIKSNSNLVTIESQLFFEEKIIIISKHLSIWKPPQFS